MGSVHKFEIIPGRVWKWRDDDAKAGKKSGAPFGWAHTCHGQTIEKKPDACPRGENCEQAGRYLPLYGAVDMVGAVAQIAFYVEGELKAQAFHERGRLAASARNGAASKPERRDLAAFYGHAVAILPDNDAPGYKHAEEVRCTLAAMGIIAATIEWTDADREEIGDGGDVIDWFAAGHTVEELERRAFVALKARWEAGNGGAGLLSDLARSIRRYVHMSSAQADVVALWAAYSHVWERFDTTPYLGIVAAEKRSGKSRVLEILNHLVRDPWMYQGASLAVFFRKIDEDKPVLLFDEAQALFDSKDENKADMLSAWLSGFKVTGAIARCASFGAELVDFSTYCPKAFAGTVSNMPDMIRDRSIIVRLVRKTDADAIEGFRARYDGPELEALRDRIAQWAAGAAGALDLWSAEAKRTRGASVPAVLHDRAAEICEPLIAVADVAGGEWPERARRALVALMTGEHHIEDESRKVVLLSDIREVFEERGVEALSSDELCKALNDAFEEHGYGAWNRGHGIEKTDLAKLLRPFGVKPGHLPRSQDFTGHRTRGYTREAFADAWNRYLAPAAVTDAEGERVIEDGSVGF